VLAIFLALRFFFLQETNPDHGNGIPSENENPVGMGIRLQLGNGKECEKIPTILSSDATNSLLHLHRNMQT